jgi:hypothetical protein
MSLSDYDDEQRQTNEMAAAHEDRERNYNYCIVCSQYYNKHIPHTCYDQATEDTKRAKFDIYLREYLNFGIKEGFLDEDTVDNVLYEYDYNMQIEWLGNMEVKAQAQVDAWEERQQDIQEGRDNSD